MTINGHELNVDRMMHEISLECAKIEVKMSRKSGNLKDEEDITKYLDRMFEAYVSNFAYLTQKSDGDIKTALNED